MCSLSLTCTSLPFELSPLTPRGLSPALQGFLPPRLPMGTTLGVMTLRGPRGPVSYRWVTRGLGWVWEAVDSWWGRPSSPHAGIPQCAAPPTGLRGGGLWGGFHLAHIWGPLLPLCPAGLQQCTRGWGVGNRAGHPGNSLWTGFRGDPPSPLFPPTLFSIVADSSSLHSPALCAFLPLSCA